MLGVADVPTAPYNVPDVVMIPPNKLSPAVMLVTEPLPVPHGEPMEVSNPEDMKAAQPAEVVATVTEPAFKKVEDAVKADA